MTCPNCEDEVSYLCPDCGECSGCCWCDDTEFPEDDDA